MKGSRKTPVDEYSAEKTLPNTSDGKTNSEHYYRCPACGALVDSRDREKVTLHHRHVLFPQQFALRHEAAKAREEAPPPGQIKR